MILRMHTSFPLRHLFRRPLNTFTITKNLSCAKMSANLSQPTAGRSSSSTTSPLHTPKRMQKPMYKLVFFVPVEDVERVKEAVFKAGAGTYPGSKYAKCAFQTEGDGQFLPLAEEGANPTIGDVGVLTKVKESRVEVFCYNAQVAKLAVLNMKHEHPYEEPAYEVVKLEEF